MVLTKNIRNIFFLLIIIISSISNAEIYTAESIEEINNTILDLLSKRNPKKTLLIMIVIGEPDILDQKRRKPSNKKLLVFCNR